MIYVTVNGMGQSYRLDAPRADMIGPWLMALFADVKPDPKMPVYFTIDISGGEQPKSKSV